jgi:FkbM family methyltransferase
MQFYSQYKQDEWLFENYFKNKTNGFFLEIGADDGIDKSNTKFYEELGWSGICVEPSHKRFKLLTQNRKCICENYAISDSTGEVEFMDISGWGKGLSGIVEKYDIRHKIRIDRELTHPKNQGNEIIKVKTEVLSNLLQKHNVTKVDFCSIDTEGSEFDIIKTIDFNKYDFGLFLIENNYGDSRVRDFLEAKEYTFVTTLTIDEVFTKNSQ